AIPKSILMQIYMLFRQQAGISALRQELDVKTPYRAMNHPVIGVVTKADLDRMEHICLVKCWLREAGAH
ncbi:EutP/PduV family microcompartment system protein, partial [Escherichia coli]|uniref:EutP/PduV family microcompartment system protein n=1 Tax=Escherichia coli TaxID=562 RepID=UPI003C088011